jgi:hypothetical protein
MMSSRALHLVLQADILMHRSTAMACGCWSLIGRSSFVGGRAAATLTSDSSQKLKLEMIF